MLEGVGVVEEEEEDLEAAEEEQVDLVAVEEEEEADLVAVGEEEEAMVEAEVAIEAQALLESVLEVDQDEEGTMGAEAIDHLTAPEASSSSQFSFL